jgi:hypothetical protein
MRHYPVILLIMLGAFGEDACRTYLHTHRAADSVFAGLGAASAALLAGLAPSPSQSKEIEKLKDAAKGQQEPGGTSADFPTAPPDPAHG